MGAVFRCRGGRSAARHRWQAQDFDCFALDSSKLVFSSRCCVYELSSPVKRLIWPLREGVDTSTFFASS